MRSLYCLRMYNAIVFVIKNLFGTSGHATNLLVLKTFKEELYLLIATFIALQQFNDQLLIVHRS